MIEVLTIFIDCVPCAGHYKGARTDVQLSYQNWVPGILDDTVAKGRNNPVNYKLFSQFNRQVIEAQKHLINDLNSLSLLRVKLWFKPRY